MSSGGLSSHPASPLPPVVSLVRDTLPSRALLWPPSGAFPLAEAGGPTAASPSGPATSGALCSGSAGSVLTAVMTTVARQEGLGLLQLCSAPPPVPLGACTGSGRPRVAGPRMPSPPSCCPSGRSAPAPLWAPPSRGAPGSGSFSSVSLLGRCPSWPQSPGNQAPSVLPPSGVLVPCSDRWPWLALSEATGTVPHSGAASVEAEG